jgi:hypothetical protein
MPAVFGILYIFLGNLAGNAVAFGYYIMVAAGKDPDENKGPVIGLAITLLAACCLFHVITRSGGIWVNNAFAVAKVGMLLMIIIMGFVHASGKYLQSYGLGPPSNITSAMINNATDSNFSTKTSFKSTGDLSGFVSSLLFAVRKPPVRTSCC